MPSVPFLRLFVGPLSNWSIVTSVPMIFLLVGLQAIMDVKFSCPCRVSKNHALSAFICVAPALVALVIMLLMLRPCKYKSSSGTSQGQNNRGTSQGQGSSGTSQGQGSSGTSQGKGSRGTSQGQGSSGTDQGQGSSGTSQGQGSRGTSQGQGSSGTDQGQGSSGTDQGQGSSGTDQGQGSRGTSQGQGSRGTSQGQGSRGTSQGQGSSGTDQGQGSSGTDQGQGSSGTSQSENELVENLSCGKASVVCCIPCLVWICLFFIDGDYLACGFTDWNGHYACDKELHPRCLNWCKPTKLSQAKNETAYYERTLELIFISKIIGYGLAIFFCILAIVFVCFDCKNKTSADRTDRGPGNEEQPEQHIDNLQLSNIENATEDASLLSKSATTSI